MWSHRLAAYFSPLRTGRDSWMVRLSSLYGSPAYTEGHTRARPLRGLTVTPSFGKFVSPPVWVSERYTSRLYSLGPQAESLAEFWSWCSLYACPFSYFRICMCSPFVSGTLTSFVNRCRTLFTGSLRWHSSLSHQVWLLVRASLTWSAARLRWKFCPACFSSWSASLGDTRPSNCRSQGSRLSTSGLSGLFATMASKTPFKSPGTRAGRASGPRVHPSRKSM
mmetsp:Transcript_78315/g.221475  ORF Transcript_78315/g.221475 Transcript_78315/m.221475 type:complete len:222 (+) Transcript_78315:339-1004(+)